MSQVILPHKMLRNAIKSKCTTFFSETRTQNQAASIQESSLGPTTKWRRRLCALQLPTAHHSSDLQTLLFVKPSARKALSTSTPTSTFWNFIARCVCALQDTWETLKRFPYQIKCLSKGCVLYTEIYTHSCCSSRKYHEFLWTPAKLQYFYNETDQQSLTAPKSQQTHPCPSTPQQLGFPTPLCQICTPTKHFNSGVPIQAKNPLIYISLPPL